MSRRIAYAIVALAAATVLLFAVRPGAGPETAADAARDFAGAATPATTTAGHLASHAADRTAGSRPDTDRPPSLPASLHDTAVDGALGVGADGRLLVNPEVRAFFDYFLTATGELPPAQLRALIVAEIEARLDADAGAEAIDILDRYLAYRRETRRAAESDEIPDDLRARLNLLQSVRRKVLGDDLADAFFATEEAMLDADLRRRDVLRDDSLPAGERLRLLAEIEANLPADVREARAEAHLPATLFADEHALRDAGGSANEIHALRGQTVGEEAARRLADLDREREAWQRRIDAYRTERATIEGDPQLADVERTARIDDLRRHHFDERERLRLDAIEATYPQP